MNDLIHFNNQADFIAKFGRELETLGIGGDSMNPQSYINYVDGLSPFDKFLGGVKFENTNCFQYLFAFEKGIMLTIVGANNESVSVNIWTDEIESVVAYHNQTIRIPKRKEFINLLKTGSVGLLWYAVGNVSDAIIKRVKPCESKEVLGSIYEFRIKSREGESIVLRMTSMKDNKYLVSKFLDKYLQTSLSTKDDKRTTCYIATVCYSDPNAPQVIKFREFRDTVLRKYLLGILFIKLYYRYSQHFSEKIYNKPFLKRSIKRILNIIYKVIR